MTIVRSITLNGTTTEEIAKNLQEEIRKIETNENANFISFASLGTARKIDPNPFGPWGLEIRTEVLVAFSSNTL